MGAGAEHDAGSAEIEPEEGFQAVGPYGLQRCGAGVNDRLLRLDEALHWMAFKKEWPRDKSLYAVFSPLIQWDEADSKYRRQVLYLLNHEGYAYPLSLGDRLNPAAVDAWGDLPFSYAHTYSMCTVREIAEAWRDSWPGYVANAEPFYRAGWVAYCKAMKRVAKANELPILWEQKYREDYYINLGDWKERCERYVRSLGRLAVPVSVAHELWGWGHAAAAVALPDAVADAAPAIASRPKTVQELEALLTDAAHAVQSAALQQGRKVVLTPQKWTFDMRQVVRARLDALEAGGMGISQAGDWVGVCLGIGRSSIVQEMTKLKDAVMAREKQRMADNAAASNPFSGRRAAG